LEKIWYPTFAAVTLEFFPQAFAEYGQLGAPWSFYLLSQEEAEMKTSG
jgi:hypothetical protein